MRRHTFGLIVLAILAAAASTHAESKAECDYSVFSAFQAVEKYGKAIGNWSTKDEVQAAYLAAYRELKSELAKIPEMKAYAGSPREINELVKKAGFDIQISEDADFATASIMRWMVEWVKKGVADTMNIDGATYQTARLNSAKCYEVGDLVVAELQANNDDRVFMAMIAPQANEDLLTVAARTFKQIRDTEPSHDYVGLIFPKVAMNVRPNITYVVGMTCRSRDGRPLILLDAKQQVKLELDHNGGRADVVTSMSVGKGFGGPRPLLINKPFLAWVVRPGLSIPLFAAYCDRDSWLTVTPK